MARTGKSQPPRLGLVTSAGAGAGRVPPALSGLAADGSDSHLFRADSVSPGTLVETALGPRPAGLLQRGDRIATRDHGLQTLRWVGHVRFASGGVLDDIARPVVIRAGSMGNGLPRRDLMVSPSQTILHEGPGVERLCGGAAAFLRAGDLTYLPGIEVVATSWAVYVCMLFDAHEVVLAEGTGLGSFRPTDAVLKGIPETLSATLFDAVPALRHSLRRAAYVPAAPSLDAREVRLAL